MQVTVSQSSNVCMVTGCNSIRLCRNPHQPSTGLTHKKVAGHTQSVVLSSPGLLGHLSIHASDTLHPGIHLLSAATTNASTHTLHPVQLFACKWSTCICAHNMHSSSICISQSLHVPCMAILAADIHRYRICPAMHVRGQCTLTRQSASQSVPTFLRSAVAILLRSRHCCAAVACWQGSSVITIPPVAPTDTVLQGRLPGTRLPHVCCNP